MTQDQLKLIEDALCRSVPVVWTRKDETDRHAKALEIVRQALAQPANQSDCGHKEYKPLCQMCMATKQKPVAYRTNGFLCHEVKLKEKNT